MITKSYLWRETHFSDPCVAAEQSKLKLVIDAILTPDVFLWEIDFELEMILDINYSWFHNTAHVLTN